MQVLRNASSEGVKAWLVTSKGVKAKAAPTVRTANRDHAGSLACERFLAGDEDVRSQLARTMQEAPADCQ